MDTETTGLEPEQGHRIIEIGCVELVNRRRTHRTWHRYLNPDREIDGAAEQVHGITGEMLCNQPHFADVADELLEFLGGAELVIHNAEFDLGFLGHECGLAGLGADAVRSRCQVVETLALARRLHPGQRNSLDALCKRYGIDNSGREYHGALLDAQLLADVFLAMTGGQATLSLDPAPGQVILGYSASHVRDSRDHDLGLLVSFQDLTEVKTLEEQLKRTDRLAAVGRLASGLAHEIRNPLASISGSVQLLSDDQGISEENRRLMGIVNREVERLNLLLGDFLNFARPAPLQAEVVDLAAMLEELAELLGAGGQAGEVAIVRRYPEHVPMFIDRQKMRQALWDLLLNAVESALPNGTVRIAVDLVNGEISVEDSGPGIDEKVRDRIFEPFFTTKEKGNGLGLANVYTNVQARRWAHLRLTKSARRRPFHDRSPRKLSQPEYCGECE